MPQAGASERDTVASWFTFSRGWWSGNSHLCALVALLCCSRQSLTQLRACFSSPKTTSTFTPRHLRHPRPTTQHAQQHRTQTSTIAQTRGRCYFGGGLHHRTRSDICNRHHSPPLFPHRNTHPSNRRPALLVQPAVNRCHAGGTYASGTSSRCAQAQQRRRAPAAIATITRRATI